jgi:hypothetical protein
VHGARSPASAAIARKALYLIEAGCMSGGLDLTERRNIGGGSNLTAISFKLPGRPTGSASIKAAAICTTPGNNDPSFPQ